MIKKNYLTWTEKNTAYIQILSNNINILIYPNTDILTLSVRYLSEIDVKKICWYFENISHHYVLEYAGGQCEQLMK